MMHQSRGPNCPKIRLLGDSFWAFLKITEMGQILGYFFLGKSHPFCIYKKMGWATFWAIFFTQPTWSPCSRQFTAAVFRNGLLGRFSSN
jgi:hypothetical protein